MKVKQPALTVQDMFRANKEEYLDSARAVARDLLRNRMTITIEDIHQVLKRPEHLHHNVTGSVFKHPDFHSVGFTVSRRPHMHNAVIRYWTLSDEYKVLDEKETD